MPQVTTLIARSSAQSAALELSLAQLPQKPLPAQGLQATAQGVQATAQGPVPVYRVQPGADLVLKVKGKVDAKLKFKKHGAHLLLEQDGQALVLLEDVFDAQGLPQASVGLRSAQAALQPWQDEAGLVDLSAQHGVGDHQVVATLQGAQPLGSIDGSTTLHHTGLSLGEQAALPSLFSTTNLVVSAAGAVAAASGGGSGGSTVTDPTSTDPSTSSTTNATTNAPTNTTTAPASTGLSITGNNLANRLVGSASANTLDGAGGDDILQGAGGDDTLIGGTGQDTAVYKGHAADYAISYDSASDTWQVRDLHATDGDEGADTLSGIERLQFSNGSLGLVSPVRDAQGNVLIAARLVGTTAADVLPTGSGYTAVGGGGDDIYIVRTGQATILEQDGQGNDTVVSYVAATLPDYVENVTVAEAGDVASTLLSTLVVSGPPVVALAELPNTSNSAFASGFAVSAGSTVTVTVNGTALTAAQLTARFATRTDSASGQTLYTAQALNTQP